MSDEEVEIFAARLRLQPGMTLCEMGSASGALLSRLAAKVMPGGKLIATNIDTQALAETRTVVIGAGYDASILTTYLATPDAWAPGLADGTCDALYSRMVIHMIPEAVVLGTYIGQWARALKPGGLMFMADHNPDSGPLDGPRRPISNVPWGGMVVVPQETEVAQITAGGFDLIDGPFEHKFIDNGYGAVYTPQFGNSSRR